MELFSEIYGIYYDIVTKILQKQCITAYEINEMAQKYGFEESALQMIPKLLDGKSWRFLEKKQGKYVSKLEKSPSMPLTILEKQFLKAVIEEKRCRLFLEEEEQKRLKQLLKDVPPLFREDMFDMFDQYQDGDDFENKNYQQIFRSIHRAMRSRHIVIIKYLGGHRSEKRMLHKGMFLPLKWEYSQKDDKFRIYCIKVEQSGKANPMVLNMGRIVWAKQTEKIWNKPVDMEKIVYGRKVKTPIVIKITSERNAIERFLIEFSTYEKESEYDEQTGVCTVRMWYVKNDETEVLIKLLGFGPVLKVMSPPFFVKQIKQRIDKQMQWIAKQKTSLYPYQIREEKNSMQCYDVFTEGENKSHGEME